MLIWQNPGKNHGDLIKRMLQILFKDFIICQKLSHPFSYKLLDKMYKIAMNDKFEFHPLPPKKLMK